MIHRIKLRNFQRHKQLTLDLEQITVLIGLNDRGKTAVFRALYWLAMARPLGDAMVRFDTDTCTVEVELEDGTVVGRRRKGSVTKYRIDDKIFKANGTNVPEEVATLLNLSEINFQQQLDPPLWFIESAGQVGKNLNSVINLEVIDETLAKMASRVKKAKQAVEGQQTIIKQAEADLKKLEWVNDFEKDVTKLSKLESRLEERENQSIYLGDMLDVADAYALTTSTLNEDLVQLKADLAEWELLSRQVVKHVEKKARLGLLIRKAEEMEYEAESNYLDLQDFHDAVGELIPLQLDYDVLVRRRKKLASILEMANNCDHELQCLAADIETEELTLKQKTKGLCPLCGNRLPSSSLTSTCPTKHP